MSEELNNPFGSENPWYFPGEVFLVWARSSECDQNVAGVWLDIDRARFHAVCLLAGKAEARGVYDDPDNMRYYIEPLHQIALPAEEMFGEAEL